MIVRQGWVVRRGFRLNPEVAAGQQARTLRLSAFSRARPLAGRVISSPNNQCASEKVSARSRACSAV